jgi:hypothetical protein
MACIIELDTARHYRDLDRRDRAAEFAERMRPELVMEWIADMDKRCDEHLELLKLLICDDPEFVDTLMQLPAIVKSNHHNVRDLCLAAMAESSGVV